MLWHQTRHLLLSFPDRIHVLFSFKTMEPLTRILEASVSMEEDDEDSHFRILVNGNMVKYITIQPGLYTEEDMCFSPMLMLILPPFPPGDWNEASVTRDPETSLISFTNVVHRPLVGVTSIWHPNKVDYFDLRLGRKWKSAVYEAEVLVKDGNSIECFAKYARFEWEISAINYETAAYECLDGEGIGPAFLGHLTEHGRVIGFLIEKIPNARHAGPEDLELCQKALAKLHSLSIKHGDTNKHNFLISEGRAIIIDFDCAEKCSDRDELEREQQGLVAQLNDTSGRGGWIPGSYAN